MNVILDTHALLWFITDDRRLSAKVCQLIEGDQRPLYLSSVVAAEISIKYSKGKLHLPRPPRELISEFLVQMQLTPLDFTLAQAARLAELPYHHRDPFDRMLVSQALEQHLPVVTDDAIFAQYGVQVVW